MALVIDGRLTIPDHELSFTASRSGGPGGQNVNKVSTRVTVFFDVVNSSVLTAHQRRRLLERLASRVSRDGVLRVVAQRARTQLANRRAALERLADLIRGALAEQRARTATEPDRAARERRLAEKKRRSRIKHLRSARPSDES